MLKKYKEFKIQESFQREENKILNLIRSFSNVEIDVEIKQTPYWKLITLSGHTFTSELKLRQGMGPTTMTRLYLNQQDAFGEYQYSGKLIDLLKYFVFLVEMNNSGNSNLLGNHISKAEYEKLAYSANESRFSGDSFEIRYAKPNEKSHAMAIVFSEKGIRLILRRVGPPKSMEVTKQQALKTLGLFELGNYQAIEDMYSDMDKTVDKNYDDLSYMGFVLKSNQRQLKNGTLIFDVKGTDFKYQISTTGYIRFNSGEVGFYTGETRYQIIKKAPLLNFDEKKEVIKKHIKKKVSEMSEEEQSILARKNPGLILKMRDIVSGKIYTVAKLVASDDSFIEMGFFD